MSETTKITELTTAPILAELNVAVSGMTCASCVSRVERRINKIPGATATVNLPLETAHIKLTGEISDSEIIAAIERAGYEGKVLERIKVAATSAVDASVTGALDGTVTEIAAQPEENAVTAVVVDEADTSAPTPDRGAYLKNRLIVSAVLSLPVMVLSMVPAWQFTGWQWLVAALTLPVVTWGAWPFHKAAFKAARYLSSTMDTLVSLGVIAATLWSLWALFFGGAGELGMQMSMSLLP